MSNLDKIKNLLIYTVTSGKDYNGRNFVTGYHTLQIEGQTFTGQRQPALRLKDVPYNFNGKAVIDIGSNQSGMLFELADKIKYGVGIDYDPRLVNVANRISNEYGYDIDFYNFDLSKEDFDLINCFSKVDKFDVILLLAICMWIPNWKELIIWVQKNSSYCLFETNGKTLVQKEQIAFLKKTFTKVEIIAETSDDDPKQKDRKLLWCIS
jgi:2-polyprenyl-3-methyl-5-hydroxy-6-metoxy-1,4-benzoquinol methylase